MKICSIINQKGGIGKTMLATNLSYTCAKMGYKTLLIDLDHQANSSSMYKPDTAEILLEDIICKKENKLVDCIYNAEINQEKIKNLYIIPTSSNLAQKSSELEAKMYRETVLKNKLDKIKNQFDICIIDCMTTSSIFTTNAIYASEYFIVPFTYGRYSLEGLFALLERVELITQNRKKKFFFVKNFFNKQTTKTNKYIDEEIEVFKEHICKTIINKSELINQADITGQPVAKFARTSKASKEIEKLTKELLNGIA